MSCEMIKVKFVDGTEKIVPVRDVKSTGDEGARSGIALVDGREVPVYNILPWGFLWYEQKESPTLTVTDGFPYVDRVGLDTEDTMRAMLFGNGSVIIVGDGGVALTLNPERASALFALLSKHSALLTLRKQSANEHEEFRYPINPEG